MNDRLYDPMDKLIESIIADYMNEDEVPEDLFYKMSLIYELHRIGKFFARATYCGKINVSGSIDTYEQN